MAASPSRTGYQIDNGSFPREAVALDVATGQAIGPRADHVRQQGRAEREFNVGVNADGTQIAVGGGAQGQVRIFDVRTGELLATIATS